MKQFDWKKFKSRNSRIAVHCSNIEEARDFHKKMCEHGIFFNSSTLSESYVFDGFRERQICYDSEGVERTAELCASVGYKILEWSDYMQPKKYVYIPARRVGGTFQQKMWMDFINNTGDNGMEIFQKKFIQSITNDLERPDINISVNGTTTEAFIVKDGTIFKKTKARLHPNDKYDYQTGVRIALDRLFGSNNTVQAEKEELYDITEMTPRPGTLIYGENKKGVGLVGKYDVVTKENLASRTISEDYCVRSDKMLLHEIIKWKLYEEEDLTE